MGRWHPPNSKPLWPIFTRDVSMCCFQPVLSNPASMFRARTHSSSTVRINLASRNSINYADASAVAAHGLMPISPSRRNVSWRRMRRNVSKWCRCSIPWAPDLCSRVTIWIFAVMETCSAKSNRVILKKLEWSFISRCSKKRWWCSGWKIKTNKLKTSAHK